MSEDELEEVEVVYYFYDTFENIKDNRIIREGMKFKKIDPKLEAIASARRAKSPAPEISCPRQKGVRLLMTPSAASSLHHQSIFCLSAL